MLKLIFKVFFRKVFGCRKNIAVVVTLLAPWLFVWFTCGWLILTTSRALMPPPPPDQDLHHFRRNRSLQYYLDNIQVLIEPSSTPCANTQEVPVIILVSSAPLNFESRQTVRDTWAKYQPTYFVMGLHGTNVDEQLVDNYIEAKEYGDLVVFEFKDHYQNLTLKTALMIHWTLARCPQAQYLFKTDDDVLVNPWTLDKVLKDNHDAQLLGYKINDTEVHRDEYTKWYVPRWLYSEPLVPEYLSGTGYLISGEYLEKILKNAYKVPLVNLEDVYFTYMVAFRHQGLSLTHDRRLSPHKPWLTIGCAYWTMASVHSLSPREMLSAWSKIERIANVNESTTACSYFENYVNSDWLLY